MPSTQLSNLAHLAPSYDALLCDVWGVIHNGIKAFPAAVEALVNYRAQGGVVVLITNAPVPSQPIIEMLDRLGVPRTAWDAIVSSGDATRALLAPYKGRIIHHVGPQTNDDALYEGLGLVRGQAAEAEVVVVTDLDHDDEEPEVYAPRVAQWLERNLPMICANPDKVVEHGDQLIYCGGALGDYYAERGGTVQMAGKPFAPIYDEAFRLAEVAAGRKLEKPRILGVGDSVRTDATGAAGFGIDLLFVSGSIHAAEIDAFANPDAAVIEALVAPSGARLAGFLPRLVW
ncbi:TIGR01459 family HAD-type hydrolase [Devosia rhodophyticola]|uniref:TIGR01459 family HAD-type hydrolase n=1 Tax=Devosia rhodophyticola TaxID=3026423 RepID=A0ABY7YZ36_9HYPH|nr:TIGR01459 family HAD-type hydrolase [Devosia rhodophyticola]WDR06614.1 TIGR01459 family HAD-type hydrolase [Devosia rhodophyticola]